MPGGRPTKYRPEHCQLLIDTMAQGFSYEASASVIGVATSKLYDWEKRHPEFREAKVQAFGKSRVFWEKVGIDNLTSDKETRFNNPVWIFNMKNRFGWVDRIDQHTTTTDIQINLDGEQALKALKYAHSNGRGSSALDTGGEGESPVLLSPVESKL